MFIFSYPILGFYFDLPLFCNEKVFFDIHVLDILNSCNWNIVDKKLQKKNKQKTIFSSEFFWFSVD